MKRIHHLAKSAESVVGPNLGDMGHAERIALISRPTGKPIDIDTGYKRVMKRFAVIMAALAASACTTTHTTTRCVTKDQLEQLKRDEPPKVAEKLTGKADEDTRVLAGSAIRLRSYAQGLLGILGGCVSD